MKLDLGALSKAIDEDLANPNGYWNSIKKKDEIIHSQKERINKYLENYFDDLFLIFLAWEEKYEEYYYTQHHCQTTSTIFERLMDCISTAESKTDLEITEEDTFTAEKFMFRDYKFELFVGQGAIWRISKGDQQIFQSK